MVKRKTNRRDIYSIWNLVDVERKDELKQQKIMADIEKRFQEPRRPIFPEDKFYNDVESKKVKHKHRRHEDDD